MVLVRRKQALLQDLERSKIPSISSCFTLRAIFKIKWCYLKIKWSDWKPQEGSANFLYYACLIALNSSAAGHACSLFPTVHLYEAKAAGKLLAKSLSYKQAINAEWRQADKGALSGSQEEKEASREFAAAVGKFAVRLSRGTTFSYSTSSPRAHVCFIFLRDASSKIWALIKINQSIDFCHILKQGKLTVCHLQVDFDLPLSMRESE